MAEKFDDLERSLAAATPTATSVAVATVASFVAASAQMTKITPLARRIALSRGLDLSSLQGSGYSGRIFTADLEFASPAALPPTETVSMPVMPPDVSETSEPAVCAPTMQTASLAFERPEPVVYVPAALPPTETASMPVMPPDVPEASAPAVCAPTMQTASLAFERPEPVVYVPAALPPTETVSMPVTPPDMPEASAPAALPPTETVSMPVTPPDVPEAAAPAALPPTEAVSAPVTPFEAPKFLENFRLAQDSFAATYPDEAIAGVIRVGEARRANVTRISKSASQSAVSTQYMETDISELLALRERMGAGRERQEPLSLTAFYLKAVAICVSEKERFRMRLSESGDAFLIFDGAHIGLTSGGSESVLFPVLRDADQKTIEELALEAALLSEKAKRGGLAASEQTGGRVTLADMGESGIHAFVPVINPPESAAIGIGSPYKRLTMTDRSLENRHYIMQSLTFDPRVINENEAAAFQRRLKELLENPQSFVF